MPQGTLKKVGRQIKSSTVETDKEVFEIAVPHEAGHAVVANELKIPVQNIAFRLRGSSGTAFASLWQPDDHELNGLMDEKRLAYCTVLAAGIAGELFERNVSDQSNDNPASSDRVLLARLTTRDIMEFVPAAKEIIHNNRRKFRQLCSRMKLRYPECRRKIESSAQDGVYLLVTQQELVEMLR